LYELINQNEADRIKEILESTWLYKNIELKVGDFLLSVSGVSESNDTEHHYPYEMSEFYLLNKDNGFDVLEYNQKKYNAFVNVGEWGTNPRLKNSHITLGSSKFHDFCFQIELSQTVKDEKNIYILKNVTNLAGPGAICRLYRGLKSNCIEKLRRRDLFIEEFGQEVLHYENKDWAVISKINIDDLYNQDKADEIFYRLIHNMFFAMLLVESIGQSNTKEII